MARPRTFLLALCLLSPGLMGMPAVMADTTQKSMGQKDVVRNDMEQTAASIRKGQARQRALTDRARAVADQIDGLRLRAARAAHLAQGEETALSNIERRLDQLQRQDKDQRQHLEKMRAGMARSITALARVERQPAVALLAAPGTMLDAARGGRLLAAALPALHRNAARVGELLAAADDVRRKLQAEQKLRNSAVAGLSARRQELGALLDERATSEQELQTAAKQEGQRLAMLASKARDLQGLMSRLETEEQNTTAIEDPRPTGVDGGDPAANIQDPATRQAALRRRKLAADIARALSMPKQPETRKTTKNGQNGDGKKSTQLAMAAGKTGISKLRGRLRLPARGSWVGRYGESTGFGPRAQGITMQTRQGAQVVAPYDGRVVFAGPFRNYGLILIISHGEGYHTLLAGLAKLQAVVGQTLLTGEPVGVMGGDDRRSLYIELRRKGTAINPNPWWSSSLERASG
ncbi:MAG: peptidoglycan DD-metalloendopeptidase family protein [Rhodospirillaceae bacterium]|jgi:murein hydrolase activator|nr:peptidoglycan DD-metalloendopeptidase family protein [Rhodospirillaceae bacterium]MBT5896609.1 peptidoglycan DD-metalloendopeptidase family protein [Rhodospirillaceae bacterium]MBT6428719.1 peptidoglycan DD-metalloendopeptidase family protein [Rhodospirillaceae bacterium]MBT7759301.1 peptidoglycan DD-metalloendopeptidase family protein [Rhodospirillaceae bacterium]